LLVANSLMALFLWWFAGDLQQWFAWHWQQRALRVAWLGVGASLIYILCLFCTGFRFSDLKIKEV
jgi:putative peptidoglycan lipid II flippase